LATWLLVGVVPIVLICALLWEGLFILMGQVVGYMTTNEITRQSESVRSTAYGLAWSLAHRESSATIPTLTETFVKETAEARHAEIGAIVRIGTETIAVPHEGAIRDIPQWSQPDFSGLVKDKGRYYFGAHIGLDGSAGKTEVFVYQYARADFFNNLLPKVATILMGPGLARAGGIDIQYDRVAEDLTS